MSLGGSVAPLQYTCKARSWPRAWCAWDVIPGCSTSWPTHDVKRLPARHPWLGGALSIGFL